MTLLPAPAGRRRASLSSRLFELRSVDLLGAGAITARTGQVGTFTRASSANMIDANGATLVAVEAEPAIDMLDLDADSAREWPALVLEKAGGGRALDLLTFPIDFRPAVCTLYLRGYFPAAGTGATDQLIAIGSADLTSDAQAGFGVYRDATTNIRARNIHGATHEDASISLSAVLAAAGTHEIVARFAAATVKISIDGSAFVTTATTLATAFGVQTLRMAGQSTMRWMDVVLAAGVRTVEELR